MRLALKNGETIDAKFDTAGIVALVKGSVFDEYVKRKKSYCKIDTDKVTWQNRCMLNRCPDAGQDIPQQQRFGK